jgi:ABC-type transport system involved in multi-copper enzyme maturation permease subunit
VLVLRQHVFFTAFSFVIVGAIQYALVTLSNQVDTRSVFGALLEQLPPGFQNMVSETFLTRMTVGGAAAFGFNHPLVMALLVINAVAIPARHISGEIENGAMEWLLALPVRRARLMVSLWVSASLVSLVTIVGAWAGSFTALAVTDNLDAALARGMFQVGANLWLLVVLVMSYTMVIASFSRPGAPSGLVAAAVTLVFYFLYVLRPVWDAIAFLEPVNIFTYYQPQKIVFGERSLALNAAVLVPLIGLCMLVAVRRFARRDIPG